MKAFKKLSFRGNVQCTWGKNIHTGIIRTLD